MRIGLLRFTPAVSFLAATLAAGGAATAQSAGQACIQQGHRPGTAGFYHCLEQVGSGESAGSGSGSQEADTGEAGSILRGTPDNAVTDYTGSTMSGATTPDPNILKQLNTPNRTPR